MCKHCTVLGSSFILSLCDLYLGALCLFLNLLSAPSGLLALQKDAAGVRVRISSVCSNGHECESEQVGEDPEERIEMREKKHGDQVCNRQTF
jgi:hypothetical protein